VSTAQYRVGMIAALPTYFALLADGVLGPNLLDGLRLRAEATLLRPIPLREPDRTRRVGVRDRGGAAQVGEFPKRARSLADSHGKSLRSRPSLSLPPRPSGYSDVEP
jgi:hypothetical protein